MPPNCFHATYVPESKISKRGHAPYRKRFNHKKIALLGYESFDRLGVFDQKLRGTGYKLDPSLSNEDTNVFHNPVTKQVSVAYQGTALNKLSRWKDLKCDLAILTEKYNRQFKQTNHHFKGVYMLNKYGPRDGCKIDSYNGSFFGWTTGKT